jgi:hypothetical protein
LLPGEAEGSNEAGSSSSGVSIAGLQQLLASGLTIELQLESLERLQSILREHSAWELHMKQVLEGNGLPQTHAHTACRCCFCWVID